jgi:hypothetical protein
LRWTNVARGNTVTDTGGITDETQGFECCLSDVVRRFFALVNALEDIRAGSRVINAEFNRALVEKYGSPASPNEARSGGCPTVWNVSAAAAEEKRQIIFTHAREHKTQLVDTGWTFVRTAQTPPPGPPAGGHG